MRIVVLSLIDPWAETTGGNLRTRGFLTAFAGLGHEVTCAFPSRARPAQPPAGIRSLAVPVEPLGTRDWPPIVRQAKQAVLPMPTQRGRHSPGMVAALRAQGPVDVLLVSSVPETVYAEGAGCSTVWLDFADLQSEWGRREASARRGPARWAALGQGRYLEGVEKRKAMRAQLVTATGWTDAQVLGRRIGREVPWLPVPVPVDDGHVPGPWDPAGGKIAGFLANFRFGPNRDAFETLARAWAPRLRRMGWRLVVAGVAAHQLPAVEGIENVGTLPTVGSFYRQVGVTLVPMRLGGGMKVKVAESLLHGRPVVASPFAVDGFPPDVRELAHVVDADHPDFSVLEHGPPALPADAPSRLSVFTRASFTAKVGQLLQTMSSTAS